MALHTRHMLDLIAAEREALAAQGGDIVGPSLRHGALADAAACYAAGDQRLTRPGYGAVWPWTEAQWLSGDRTGWTSRERIRELAMAGAYILAEMEQLAVIAAAAEAEARRLAGEGA